MKSSSSLAAVVGCLLSCACSQEPAVIDRSPAEPAIDAMRMAVLRQAVLDNGFVRSAALRVPVDPAKREAGRLLFESRNMSLDGTISCQDCHLDQFGSTDGNANAVGAGAKGEGPGRMADSEHRILPRNVLPFWGRGSKGFNTFFWDGKVTVDSGKIVSQFGDSAPSTDPMIVAAHLPSVELREMIEDSSKIRQAYVTESVDAAAIIQKKLAAQFAADKSIGPRLYKAFRLPPDRISFIHIADALSSFIRDEFRIRPNRLEHFVYDNGAISKQELAGGILFYGRGKCSTCHNGPYFTDFQFHAVAFPQAGFGKNGFGVDEGRYNVTHNPFDRFLFRTPPLFNVTKTAPYSHSGSVAGLEDAIIAHFDPLRFTDPGKMTLRERTDLLERLGPASREPLPASMTDDEVRAIAAFLTMLDFEKSPGPSR